MASMRTDIFSDSLFFKLQPTVVTVEEENEQKRQQTSCHNKTDNRI